MNENASVQPAPPTMRDVEMLTREEIEDLRRYKERVSEYARKSFAHLRPKKDLGNPDFDSKLLTDGILNYRDVPRLPVIDTSAFKKAPKEKLGGQAALDL